MLVKVLFLYLVSSWFVSWIVFVISSGSFWVYPRTTVVFFSSSCVWKEHKYCWRTASPDVVLVLKSSFADLSVSQQSSWDVVCELSKVICCSDVRVQVFKTRSFRLFYFIVLQFLSWILMNPNLGILNLYKSVWIKRVLIFVWYVKISVLYFAL